jgi:hypothetical protein
MVNSIQKGKRGEREFCKYLKQFMLTARRGQQFMGGGDSPDVICPDLPNTHFEIKRQERGNVYDWLDQAISDADRGQTPIVFHRRNGREWIAIMRGDDAIRMIIMGKSAVVKVTNE